MKTTFTKNVTYYTFAGDVLMRTAHYLSRGVTNTTLNFHDLYVYTGGTH